MAVVLISVIHKMQDGGLGWCDITARPPFLAWHHAGFMPAANQSPDDEWNQIQVIERYHISQGYGQFGYHGIAFPSGRAYLTGDMTRCRAHVARRNHEGVGICLMGDFSNSVPGDDQLAGARLLRDVFVEFWGQPEEEAGHTDFAVPDWPTTCPGSRRHEWIPRIRGEEDDWMARLSDEQVQKLGALADYLMTPIQFGGEWYNRQARRIDMMAMALSWMDGVHLGTIIDRLTHIEERLNTLESETADATLATLKARL